LRDATQSLFDLRLHHLTEWGIQKSARQISDMLWYTLPNKEHCKVLGEIVAVMEEEIVGLQRVRLDAERNPE
jgi:hypothetical protein